MYNSAVRTAIVAKISLPAFIPQELVRLGFVSNLNDCFVIGSEFSENMKTTFRLPASFVKPGQSDIVDVCPKAGDKMIGQNRDKGCVTSVLSEYHCVAKMVFDSKEVADRFRKFFAEIGKTTLYTSPTSFDIFIDVVAHDSATRDNVGALALNSLMEWKAIAEDTTFELSEEEVFNIDLMALADEYPCSFEVKVIDSNANEVYSFGEVPLMIEDFFWQPQHSNEFKIKEKKVSVAYNQARDAVKILMPSLAEVMIDTADFSSIKEDMMLLGLEIGSPSGFISKINALSTTNADPGLSETEELLA